MAEDIDALAAAAHAHGQDAIDVAVERVATLIDARDQVALGRQDDPGSFPGFGPTDKDVIGRRVVASLLDAGWRPPPDEAVADAAARSRHFTSKFNQWLSGLDSGDRDRAISHYAQHGEFPPDLRPPSI